MRAKKLYIWSIISNIFGIILGLLLASNVDFGRFLPMYKNEQFNYSIFFLLLLIFWIISLILFIMGYVDKINFSNAKTTDEYDNNYLLKKNLKKYVLISLFLILYIISFILWMMLYDNNVEYCYFLCTIYEVIIISLIVPFLFSFMVILLIKIFKKKKGFFLK